MRGPECHPWAGKISLRACECGLRKFLGALGPASPPGVARRSPPTRIGRPEGQTNQRSSSDGEQRSSIRRTPVGGRPPGRRQHTAGNGPGIRTSHSGGSRGDCAGAAEAGHAWCRGSADVLVGGLWQIVRCNAAAKFRVLSLSWSSTVCSGSICCEAAVVVDLRCRLFRSDFRHGQ